MPGHRSAQYAIALIAVFTLVARSAAAQDGRQIYL